MPPLPAINTFVSVEEYLAGELQRNQTRIRRWPGLCNGRRQSFHGLIVNALAFALTPAARHKHCQLFTSDMKLRLSIAGKMVFYYPDLLLSCAPDDRSLILAVSPA